MSKKINNIGKFIKKSPLQVTALALYLDVDETTISKWNSNIAQPSLKRLDEVGDVIEVNNTDLVISEERKSTGLPAALQIEYKRLLKSGMLKKVEAEDDNGELKEINNPMFVQALRDFVEIYKRRIRSKYLDLLF